MYYFNHYTNTNPTAKQRQFFKLLSLKCIELGIAPEPQPGTRQGYNNAINTMSNKLLKKGLDYTDLTVEKLKYLLKKESDKIAEPSKKGETDKQDD